MGLIIGTGPGRGIGFLFVVSGLLVSILGLIIGRVKSINAMESKLLDLEAGIGASTGAGQCPGNSQNIAQKGQAIYNYGTPTGQLE